jgi:hypothetical protein
MISFLRLVHTQRIAVHWQQKALRSDNDLEHDLAAAKDQRS